nr:hypothetical protein CFP56_36274 [Quercus suber]
MKIGLKNATNEMSIAKDDRSEMPSLIERGPLKSQERATSRGKRGTKVTDKSGDSRRGRMQCSAGQASWWFARAGPDVQYHDRDRVRDDERSGIVLMSRSRRQTDCWRRWRVSRQRRQQPPERDDSTAATTSTTDDDNRRSSLRYWYPPCRPGSHPPKPPPPLHPPIPYTLDMRWPHLWTSLSTRPHRSLHSSRSSRTGRPFSRSNAGSAHDCLGSRRAGLKRCMRLKSLMTHHPCATRTWYSTVGTGPGKLRLMDEHMSRRLVPRPSAV